MGVLEDRAAEHAEWVRFTEWARGAHPRGLVLTKLSALAGRGNHYAVEFEGQLEFHSAPAISRPSVWGNVTTGASIQTNGGGRTMPYSGLHKE